MRRTPIFLALIIQFEQSDITVAQHILTSNHFLFSKFISSHSRRNWRDWWLAQQMDHQMTHHGIYGTVLAVLASLEHSVSSIGYESFRHGSCIPFRIDDDSSFLVCIFIRTVAILFGFWNCFGVLTINFSSVLSGILQIIVGILVMAIEAPVCCMFLDHAQKLAQLVESRPHYYRAGAYCM